MKALKEFVIPFVGLKEGIHDYSYDIGEKFFESFEYSEVNHGKIHAEVNMDRKERMLIFDFKLKGHLTIPCDRCMEEMDYPIDVHEGLIIKFGQEHKEETEEIIIIPETDSHIDISGFIYEYIMLALPIKKVHPDGEEACDPSVIEKLNHHSSTEVDPRWEALKDLKKNIE